MFILRNCNGFTRNIFMLQCFEYLVSSTDFIKHSFIFPMLYNKLDNTENCRNNMNHSFVFSVLHHIYYIDLLTFQHHVQKKLLVIKYLNRETYIRTLFVFGSSNIQIIRIFNSIMFVFCTKYHHTAMLYEI